MPARLLFLKTCLPDLVLSSIAGSGLVAVVSAKEFGEYGAYIVSVVGSALLFYATRLAKPLADARKARIEAQSAERIAQAEAEKQERKIRAEAEAQERVIKAQSDADIAKIAAEADANRRRIAESDQVESNRVDIERMHDQLVATQAELDQTKTSLQTTIVSKERDKDRFAKISEIQNGNILALENELAEFRSRQRTLIAAARQSSDNIATVANKAGVELASPVLPDPTDEHPTIL